MVLADTDIERVLIVTAHPDDVDFGFSGTIAGWTAAGLEVSYCVCTDGDAGGFDPDVPRERIAGIRRAEQRAAAEELGVSDVRFLGYPDGRLTVSLDLRRDIARVIRQVRPQRLVTQRPGRTFQRIGVNHPDHLAAGEAALCAVYPDARNPFAFAELAAEGLEPWVVQEVWLGAFGDESNHVVDITDTFPQKVKALLRHESQITEPEALEPRLREWNGANALAGGLPEGRLAEAFYVMPTA